MKKVIFYFEDGSYLSAYGHGKTDRECIKDAESILTKSQVKEIDSVSVLEPLPSEF